MHMHSTFTLVVNPFMDSDSQCCSMEVCKLGSDGRLCLPLVVIVAYVRQMSQKYGGKTVFVASDSTTVSAHLQRELKGFRILQDTAVEKEKDSLTPDKLSVANYQTNRMKRGEMNGHTVAQSALADIQLLSECSSMVLTDSIFSQVAILHRMKIMMWCGVAV